MNKNLKDLIVNYTTKLKDENTMLKQKLEDYDRIKTELDDITNFIKTQFSMDDIMKLDFKETPKLDNSFETVQYKFSNSIENGTQHIDKPSIFPKQNLTDKLKDLKLSKIHKSKKYFDKRRQKNSMVLFTKNNPPPSESEVNTDSDVEVVENSFNLPIKLIPPSINVNEKQNSLDTIKNLFKNDIITIKKK
jgi:hypothetical protein